MKSLKYGYLIILILLISLHTYQYNSIEWLAYIGIAFFFPLGIIIRHIELKSINANLEKAHESALENMIYLINLHDKETGEHLLRTKYYAKSLATSLYRNKTYPKIVTPHFIEHLVKSCPLHDIGKIGIPDSILKKPGRLTKEEYAIIKQHPVMGKKIVDQGLLNDLSAVSTYAPYMDAMFLDNRFAALLSEEPLVTELNYKARIYSLRSKDAFLSYLAEIEENTPDEVRDLAARIYGMA